MKAFQAYFVTSRAGMPSLCTSRRQPRTSRRVENIMTSPPLKLSYSPLLPGHSRLKITPQGGRTPRSLSRAGLFDDQDLLATQTHFVGLRERLNIALVRPRRHFITSSGSPHTSLMPGNSKVLTQVRPLSQATLISPWHTTSKWNTVVLG